MKNAHQQHLDCNDMKMIKRVLVRVRSLYGLVSDSEEERNVASVLVEEFQIGNVTEDGLYSVFLGAEDNAAHQLRKNDMMKSLDDWRSSSL